ncbi:MAG TPA: hypothetical protein VF771_12665 [Longimicrobiaceae bacterium]
MGDEDEHLGPRGSGLGHRPQRLTTRELSEMKTITTIRAGEGVGVDPFGAP